MEGFMYFSNDDYDQGIEFVKEKAETFLKKQAEYVDPVISLQEDSTKKNQQVIEDLQSKLKFLHGMEAVQVQHTLLMVEGLTVIQNQLATIIKLLQDLSAVTVDTNVMTNYLEINTNLIEENTSQTEEHTRRIEKNTGK
jgi:hypothetical protein